VEQEALDCT